MSNLGEVEITVISELIHNFGYTQCLFCGGFIYKFTDSQTYQMFKTRRTCMYPQSLSTCSNRHTGNKIRGVNTIAWKYDQIYRDKNFHRLTHQKVFTHLIFTIQWHYYHY